MKNIYNTTASEVIKRLKNNNAWHEVQEHSYFKLLGIQGKGGNNFYWFKIYDETFFFDHCYHWGSGKVSRSNAKNITAYNTLERLIK
jgi:hypothetical protein